MPPCVISPWMVLTKYLMTSIEIIDRRRRRRRRRRWQIQLEWVHHSNNTTCWRYYHYYHAVANHHITYIVDDNNDNIANNNVVMTMSLGRFVMKKQFRNCAKFNDSKTIFHLLFLGRFTPRLPTVGYLIPPIRDGIGEFGRWSLTVLIWWRWCCYRLPRHTTSVSIKYWWSFVSIFAVAPIVWWRRCTFDSN